MANKSVVITITCAKQDPTALALLNAPQEGMKRLVNYLEACSLGTENASVDVQTSAVAPVRAAQVLTVTFGSMTNLDTVVVAGVTLTAVTGTPAGAQFKMVTDSPTTAANLVALVNSLASVSVYVTAANVAGVVTLTSLVPGKIGNFLPLVGSAGMVATGATLVGGLGASETAPSTYRMGL